jgi:hypothetical protein
MCRFARSLGLSFVFTTDSVGFLLDLMTYPLQDSLSTEVTVLNLNIAYADMGFYTDIDELASSLRDGTGFHDRVGCESALANLEMSCAANSGLFRRIWSSILYPRHYTLSLMTRAQRLIAWTANTNRFLDRICIDPASICLLLREGAATFHSEDIAALEDGGYPILRVTTQLYQLGYTFPNSYYDYAWNAMLRNLATHSRELSGTIREIGFVDWRPAFLQLVLPDQPWLQLGKDVRQHFCTLEGTLRYWLRGLHSGGVNLQDYGRRQQVLLQRAVRHNPEALKGRCHLESGEFIRLQLESFRYGPRPEDWHVVWDWDSETAAGEFWDMMESPWLQMPGAWGSWSAEEDHMTL